MVKGLIDKIREIREKLRKTKKDKDLYPLLWELKLLLNKNPKEFKKVYISVSKSNDRLDGRILNVMVETKNWEEKKGWKEYKARKMHNTTQHNTTKKQRALAPSQKNNTTQQNGKWN